MKYDDSYIKEETVCGYTVTGLEKKVRTVQLEILRQIIRICEKYGLNYYAEGGTLIGAVRHKGFIPWDDDIDIVLKREDFNRFCEVAQGELEYPYHFMSSATEKGFFANSVYISNSETTCVDADNKNNYWQRFDKGISIGIEAMDNCNSDLKFVKLMRMKLKLFSVLGNIYTGINRKSYFKPVRFF